MSYSAAMSWILAWAAQEEISRKAGYFCGTIFIFAVFAIPMALCIRWARVTKSPAQRVVAIIGAIVFGILVTGMILGALFRG